MDKEIMLDESLEICFHMVCHKYGIENYTINEDGSIDVNGSVWLFQKDLDVFPVRFGTVTGDFSCSFNRLKTLEGGPHTVGGNYSCHNNQLTDLRYAPMSLVGEMRCKGNPNFSKKEIVKYYKSIGRV